MTLLLFLFWILLNGRVTVEIVLVGAAVSAALAWFARRTLHLPRMDGRAPRRLPGVFSYLVYLLGQVAAANLQVMGLILSPKRVRPRLVWFRPRVEGELARLALANSITLTPGTVTVALEGDMICVYALSPELAKGLKDSGFTEKLTRLEGGDHG